MSKDVQKTKVVRLFQFISWSMAAILHNSFITVAFIMHMQPQAITPAMTTMRNYFPFLYEHGALLGGPSGCWSSAIISPQLE